MHLLERLHMLHRCLRYRFRTEPDPIRYVMRELPRGATVLDVGANRGIYGYWIGRRVGPRGRVVGFEPQPETAAAAAAFLQRMPQVRIECLGVGDRPRTTQVYRRRAHHGGARVYDTDEAPPAEPGLEAVDVRIVTLDDYCAQHELRGVDLLKIDVEGREDEVLRGAREVLQRDRPVVIVECHEEAARKGEVFDLLHELGYRGRFFLGGHLYPLEEHATRPYRKPGMTHRDYLFEHAG